MSITDVEVQILSPALGKTGIYDEMVVNPVFVSGTPDLQMGTFWEHHCLGVGFVSLFFAKPLEELGLLEVPDDCDVFIFFLMGKAQDKPGPALRAQANRKNGNNGLSIERLFKIYFDGCLLEGVY